MSKIEVPFEAAISLVKQSISLGNDRNACAILDSIAEQFLAAERQHRAMLHALRIVNAWDALPSHIKLWVDEAMKGQTE